MSRSSVAKQRSVRLTFAALERRKKNAFSVEKKVCVDSLRVIVQV